MSTRIQQLWRQWQARPFPQLGKDIGDFPLYDSFLAGIASRAVDGERFSPDDVPQPDIGTISAIRELRQKQRRSTRENELLEYYSLLEEIQAAIVR